MDLRQSDKFFIFNLLQSKIDFRPVWVRRFAPLLAWISLLYYTASGCPCLGIPSPQQALFEANAVFIGTVTRIDLNTRFSDLNENDTSQRVFVRVEEAFTGTRTGAVFVLDQPGRKCTPKFNVGGKYLLYANFDKKGKTWEVSGCGRTALVERATDDLHYLRALPKALGRTRISGVVEHFDTTPKDGFSFVSAVPGVKVKITGEGKTVETITDAEGFYEVYDLPPGDYGISIEIPKGLNIRLPMPFGELGHANERQQVFLKEQVTIRLAVRGCSGANFVLSSNCFIQGIILTSNGAPLGGIPVELVSLEPTVSPDFRFVGRTDAKGRYRIENVPPGKYLLLAKTSPNHPDRYFPGSIKKENAEVVVINAEGDPQFTCDFLIEVPPNK